MNYLDGKPVKIGDTVILDGTKGVVVCSIGTADYSVNYPKADWGYLGEGVLIDFEKYGLIHYSVLEEGIELIGRENIC